MLRKVWTTTMWLGLCMFAWLVIGIAMWSVSGEEAYSEAYSLNDARMEVAGGLVLGTFLYTIRHRIAQVFDWYETLPELWKSLITIAYYLFWFIFIVISAVYIVRFARVAF